MEQHRHDGGGEISGPKLDKGWIYTEISFFVEPTGEASEETIYWNVTNVNDGESSYISGEEFIRFEIKPDIRYLSYFRKLLRTAF